MLTEDHSVQSFGPIRYKVFTRKRWGFVWNNKQLIERVNEIRDDAMSFINTEIGSENVISVVESAIVEYRLACVVVWYRGNPAKKHTLDADFG